MSGLIFLFTQPGGYVSQVDYGIKPSIAAIEDAVLVGVVESTDTVRSVTTTTYNEALTTYNEVGQEYGGVGTDKLPYPVPILELIQSVVPVFLDVDETDTYPSTTTATYNETGITYNEVGQEYGGVGYDVKDIPRPVFDRINSIKPVFLKVGNL